MDIRRINESEESEKKEPEKIDIKVSPNTNSKKTFAKSPVFQRDKESSVSVG